MRPHLLSSQRRATIIRQIEVHDRDRGSGSIGVAAVDSTGSTRCCSVTESRSQGCQVIQINGVPCTRLLARSHTAKWASLLHIASLLLFSCLWSPLIFDQPLFWAFIARWASYLRHLFIPSLPCPPTANPVWTAFPPWKNHFS